jgi:hypothetical protein
LRDAVAGFLRRERDHVDFEIDALADYAPFREGD